MDEPAFRSPLHSDSIDTSFPQAKKRTILHAPRLFPPEGPIEVVLLQHATPVGTTFRGKRASPIHLGYVPSTTAPHLAHRTTPIHAIPYDTAPLAPILEASDHLSRTLAKHHIDDGDARQRLPRVEESQQNTMPMTAHKARLSKDATTGSRPGFFFIIIILCRPSSTIITLNPGLLQGIQYPRSPSS